MEDPKNEKPETAAVIPGFPHPTLPGVSPTPTPAPAPCTCTPTIERLTPSGPTTWSVTCNPDVDVTFVAPGSHAGIIHLPNGKRDGFAKRIQMSGLNNGGVSIVPDSYGDGKQILIPSSCPGAAILTWDASQGMWLTTALWDAQMSSS